ncbi:MAG: diaminopimelate epimerase [Alphaproteobacteria bacterium]
MTAFVKMHGLGNDFVVFDARKQGLPMDARLARAVGDRHFGVGCDQVIVIERARDGTHAFMRVFNADGAEAESCGNAARCVARLLMDEAKLSEVSIDTASGPLRCVLSGEGNVTVDMGAPRFDWREIPMAQAVDTVSFALPVAGFEEKALMEAAAVSMGNPHCVLFVADAETAPIEKLGPAIENHAWFPAHTNVVFAERQGEALRLRVWERGAGMTLACGTGACAAVVAASRRGLLDRKSAVIMDGGTLQIEWRESDNHVLMTGPAVVSFSGEADLMALERPE